MLRNFTTDESGAVYIWVAGSLFAVFGRAALVIDTGYLYVMRNQLQTAADSAALAGATVMADKSAMRQEARKYAQLNLPNTANALVDADIEAIAHIVQELPIELALGIALVQSADFWWFDALRPAPFVGKLSSGHRHSVQYIMCSR